MKDPALLVKKLNKFRDERDWKRYHTPKDLAVSMTLEAAEVLEHFQWKSDKEIEKYVREHRDDIAEELADVLKYLLQLAHDIGVKDMVDVAIKKLERDAKKYPIEKIKGKYIKYTKL